MTNRRSFLKALAALALGTPALAADRKAGDYTKVPDVPQCGRWVFSLQERSGDATLQLWREGESGRRGTLYSEFLLSDEHLDVNDYWLFMNDLHDGLLDTEKVGLFCDAFFKNVVPRRVFDKVNCGESPFGRRLCKASLTPPGSGML